MFILSFLNVPQAPQPQHIKTGTYDLPQILFFTPIICDSTVQPFSTIQPVIFVKHELDGDTPLLKIHWKIHIKFK